MSLLFCFCSGYLLGVSHAFSSSRQQTSLGLFLGIKTHLYSRVSPVASPAIFTSDFSRECIHGNDCEKYVELRPIKDHFICSMGEDLEEEAMFLDLSVSDHFIAFWILNCICSYLENSQTVEWFMSAFTLFKG
ncbi:uncharacterized protein LOC143853204 [Tasmannia lanceolata]|uniref:uncharacterized protein LOC143853203 n=1 Tax=Tasmannia lanceolata TaxID=3420 RepID=UPI0040635EB7